jgi:hypothetical protein
MLTNPSVRDYFCPKGVRLRDPIIRRALLHAVRDNELRHILRQWLELIGEGAGGLYNCAMVLTPEAHLNLIITREAG